MSNHFVRGTLASAATLSVFALAACGPSPTPTPSASPTTAPSTAPSASAAPSTAPSASAAPSTAPTASAAPTTAPTASAAPTTAPSADASATPASSATATPTQDISTVEKTTFNGKVYDDTGAPLDGASVTVKSLSESVPFEATATTNGGSYSFNNAPSGVSVEILTTKAGFTTRRRVEVLKSNKQGDPNANKYDFGNVDSSTTASAFGGSINNALSDKPEVITATPGRNASGVDPKTSFVLKFSEPMDKKTVEDTLTVRAFTQRTLTVDAGSGTFTFSGDATAGDSTLGDLVWDKNAFNITWNTDDSEATFAFKEEKQIPTDKDTDKTPDYEVGFTSVGTATANGLLKDKSGISRNSTHFKLTDGNFEHYYKFAINTDSKKPEVSSITAQTNENQGTNGDAIKVVYSEPMVFYTSGSTIAGGMEDRKAGGVTGSDKKGPANLGYTNVTAKNTAANYNVLVTRNAGATTVLNGTWASLNGTAVFDTNDVTHKTVLLLPPTIAGQGATAAEQPDLTDTVSVKFGYTDGTVDAAVNTTTDSWRTQTASVAAVPAGPPGLNQNLVETITFYYTNGTTEAVDLSTPGANTYAGVDAALELLTTGGAQWTVNDTTNNNNATYEAADQINITLAAGTQRSAKTIAYVKLVGGIFAAAVSNVDQAAAGYFVVPASNDVNMTQYLLNSLLDTTTTGTFTVTETNVAGGAGVWAATDTYTVALGATAKSKNANTKTVQSATISQAGVFDATDLNAASTGMIVVSTATTSGNVDLYKQGDVVKVTVNTTVLDPAGNTLDSSRDDATANAS